MDQLEFPSLTKKELHTTLKEITEQKDPRIHLQHRDHGILKFILEQKFCTLEVIYLRFFNKKGSERLPKNFWVTRQRLAKLRSIGLLRTEKVLSSGRAHYLITTAGYKFVIQQSEESAQIQPTKKIDFSLYEHDVRITMVRACFEIQTGPKKWYSEKWLKANPIPVGNYRYKFSKDLRPDAVYIKPNGEVTAFELEISKKSLRRIREKIHLYKGLLEKPDSWVSDRPIILNRVWIVATSMSVARKYRQAIGELKDPSRFRVDLYEDLIPKFVRSPLEVDDEEEDENE